MGTLDQAFLKAYNKGFAAETARPRSAPSPQPERTADVAAHAPVPRPHTAAFFTTAPVVEPSAERNLRRIDAAHEPETVLAPRMLSTDRVRPAFEVERFTWPALSALLVDRARSPHIETMLLYRHTDRAHVLAVAGERVGTGCSTVCLTLARLAASRGRRTAVVDVDFRAPMLAEMLGVDPPRGWEEVLLGRDPLGEALIESPADRITLMPLRSRGSSASLLTGRLAGALGTLACHHDLTILDLGPLDNDAAALDAVGLLQGATIDEAIIVRDADRSTDNAVALVGRRLLAAGIARWSIADNFVRS